MLLAVISTIVYWDCVSNGGVSCGSDTAVTVWLAFAGVACSLHAHGNLGMHKHVGLQPIRCHEEMAVYPTFFGVLSACVANAGCCAYLNASVDTCIPLSTVVLSVALLHQTQSNNVNTLMQSNMLVNKLAFPLQ